MDCGALGAPVHDTPPRTCLPPPLGKTANWSPTAFQLVSRLLPPASSTRVLRLYLPRGFAGLASVVTPSCCLFGPFPWPEGGEGNRTTSPQPTTTPVWGRPSGQNAARLAQAGGGLRLEPKWLRFSLSLSLSLSLSRCVTHKANGFISAV